MAHPLTMQRLCVLALLSLALTSQLPRGVSPEYARYYDDLAGSGFSCISDSTLRLSPGQVNDNSCDCPDGSDEPGTAACSHLNPLSPAQPLPQSAGGSTNTTNVLPGFWCANAGHESGYVPFRFVNDGVCDHELCCDGSEEWGSSANCADQCAQIGQAARRQAQDRRAAHASAASMRSVLLEKARMLRRQAEVKVAGLRDELKVLEARRDELRDRFEDVQRQERGKLARGEGTGGKLGVLLGLARTRVAELRAGLESVLARQHGLSKRVEELEHILATFKEDHNPNFNDEGVKTAVKAWEDYAANRDQNGESADGVTEDDLEALQREDGEEYGINWAEFEEQPTDTDILFALEAYLPGPLRSYLHSKLNMLRIWMIEHGLLADNVRSSGDTRLEAAAREVAEAAELNFMKTRESLEEEERELARDYGADDIFRAMRGRCLSIEISEYVYELCWHDKVTQRAKHGGNTGGTSLGRFSRVDVLMADEEERDGRGLGEGLRMVLRFDQGQVCWNGPPRRADIWLACSNTEAIWRVSESEKCVYRFEVGTPLACLDLETVAAGPAEQKDEL